MPFYENNKEKSLQIYISLTIESEKFKEKYFHSIPTELTQSTHMRVGEN